MKIRRNLFTVYGAASRLDFEIGAISDMQSIEMRSILFTLLGRIIQRILANAIRREWGDINMGSILNAETRDLTL